MKKLETFVKAIIAGGFIGIGGTVYLMAESKIVGALLFSVGLFSICTMNFNLFTGKVCYVFENKLTLFTFKNKPIKIIQKLRITNM